MPDGSIGQTVSRRQVGDGPLAGLDLAQPVVVPPADRRRTADDRPRRPGCDVHGLLIRGEREQNRVSLYRDTGISRKTSARSCHFSPCSPAPLRFLTHEVFRFGVYLIRPAVSNRQLDFQAAAPRDRRDRPGRQTDPSPAAGPVPASTRGRSDARNRRVVSPKDFGECARRRPGIDPERISADTPDTLPFF